MACEERADQVIADLRSEVFSALDSGEEPDLGNLEPLAEGDIRACAEGEFQGLLAQRANAVLQEMYVSEEFARADEAARHTVGNRLAILVLALNDELPTPAPS